MPETWNASRASAMPDAHVSISDGNGAGEDGRNDQQILIKLDRYFTSAVDHPTWVSWRKHALQCYAYKEAGGVDGEGQWTKAELAELKRRSQPPTQNNQVKVTLDRMLGQFVRQGLRLGVVGRNAPQDEQVAQVLTDVFLYIRQSTRQDYEERETADAGFTCGFGVLETFVTFDDLLQPEIKIRAVSPFEIFPDPYSRRYDWNEDAQFICRAKWLDFDEASELYPDHALELRGLAASQFGGGLLGSEGFRNENYVDMDEHGRPRRVRIVECWHKGRKRESIPMADGGPTIERVTSTMRVGTFTAGILLSYRDSPHGTPLFPFVPYFVYRKESGEPYSLVWTALSIQDAINKRESKALHLLNTNQALVGQNAITDRQAFADELARPDGIMEVRDVSQVQIQRNLELAQSQFVMHQESKADYRRVVGINPDAMGEKSEVRSGVGIARKQMMTDTILAPVFDNFSRTRRLLGLLLLALVRQYYREPKLLLITDQMGASRQVALGARELMALKQAQYDVTVEEQPDVASLQQEQFAMLGTMLPQILPFGASWVELLIQMSALRNKDELIQRVRAMSTPPPPDPKISVALQWGDLTPEEKMAWAGRLGMPALAQAQMMHPQPTVSERELERGRQHSENEAGWQEVELAKVRAPHSNEMKSTDEGNTNPAF